MRPHTSFWTGVSFPFLLLSAFLMQRPLAAGQAPSLPPQSDPAPEVRGRLAEAAQDSRLEPWQREFMLGVARGTTEEGATERLSALPGLAPPPATTTSIDGDWTEVAAPSTRYLPTAIYDPLRDRMVLFGGHTGSTFLNDVWVLSLAGSPVWTQLFPAGTPPSIRYGHTAIYDPVRDRMVVFGGYPGQNDVWALSLAGSPTWSQLAPTGTPPTPRYHHAAIYDPVRDRMLVFGGIDGSGYLSDVWELSLAGSPAWNPILPSNPPSGRYEPAVIYDPVRDRMVVFGGVDASGFRNDLWVLPLAEPTSWNELTPAGTPPSARNGTSAIYDPVRDRMLVFGGEDVGGVHNDVGALSLAGTTAWSVLAPSGSPPSPRRLHAAIYDPVRDRMVVSCGYDGGSFNDAWALSLPGSTAWSALVATPPSARAYHTAIYDPVRERMVVFGGLDASGYCNDVWALSLAGGPAWSQLAPTGTPPVARYYHTAIYDPVRDRMVVFGGSDGGSYRNDVWALSLAGSPAWSQLAPTGTPPSARFLHTAIYDPVRDRMVVFGGYAGGPQNDVWALSLAGSPAWSQLAPTGTPPSARYSNTAIYDPMRDRMVVFGGNDVSSRRNDLWTLAWHALGDRVWEDTDGDGVQDAGEPGAANVLVALYDGAGTFLDATVTNASGTYVFANISVGATYRLRFVPPTGQVLTAMDQGGDDLLDSDADPVTQLTPAFVHGLGQDSSRWDAGLIPSCSPPDERIFIYTVTQSTDGNHYPILNFQDGNQPSQITGYNVYRSSNRALPPASWPLVASDVIDMDQGTPNKQWVDTSGAIPPGGTWYYQVTAVNSRCPAEGPF
jgi:SdrD B-like domain/Galactose oxidase, central domain/Kelch motif